MLSIELLDEKCYDNITMPEFTARQSGISWPEGRLETVATQEMLTQELSGAPDSLIEIIEEMEPNSFTLDQRFIPGISAVMKTAQFIEVDDFKKTREASLHQVKFGQLLINSRDGGENSVHVAIKPLDYVDETAHSYAVSSYITEGNLPGIKTFRPLGFYSFESGQPAVVSLYRHQVRSADTVMWNPNALDNTSQTARVLGNAALTLARVHAQGWTHGDAQIKNFATDITQEIDDVFLNDVEDSYPFPETEDGEIDYGGAILSMDQDLQLFTSSLFYMKDRGVKLPDNYVDNIWTNFFKIYANARERKTTRVPLPSKHRLAEILDEQVKHSRT